MKDLFIPLSDEKYERLNQFLLDRVDEEADTIDKDEGVLDVSELDGLLTAVVSGPATTVPSQWLPAVWGDFKPVWVDEQEFQAIFSLMMRHINVIARILIETPDAFEPMFLERTVEGQSYTIVDEWCEGYWRGVRLTREHWDRGGEEMTVLLAPILAFTSETSWLGHDHARDEVVTIQQAITPSVRAIHAYWLARRAEHEPAATPVRHSGPRVGRNDPCPCGSGRKYKKCCLQ